MLHRRLTRRTVAAAALATSAMGTLAPQLRAQEASPSASPEASPIVDSPLSPDLPQGGVQADGSWAFTDDRGVTLTLPETPTKVVAYIGFAAALYDLGFEVIGYYGNATNEDGSLTDSAGRLPVDRIPSVATADGESWVDVEKLVELGTEVFIGPNYGIETEPAIIWPLDADILAQIGEFAQVIHIAAADGADVERTIETMANLATAFGADLDTEEITTAKDAFYAAKANLQAAIAAKPNLTTLWMAGSATGFWTQGSTNDILFMQKLGVQFAGNDFGSAEEQSWETFATVWAADLIFNDVRSPRWWSVEQLTEEIPTYKLHPAVAAGQVRGWRNTFTPSYVGFTPIIEDYTDAFLNADETIVP